MYFGVLNLDTKDNLSMLVSLKKTVIWESSIYILGKKSVLFKGKL